MNIETLVLDLARFNSFFLQASCNFTATTKNKTWKTRNDMNLSFCCYDIEFGWGFVENLSSLHFTYWTFMTWILANHIYDLKQMSFTFNSLCSVFLCATFSELISIYKYQHFHWHINWTELTTELTWNEMNGKRSSGCGRRKWEHQNIFLLILLLCKICVEDVSKFHFLKKRTRSNKKTQLKDETTLTTSTWHFESFLNAENDVEDL
jgi:hypothetical protein